MLNCWTGLCPAVFCEKTPSKTKKAHNSLLAASCANWMARMRQTFYTRREMLSLRQLQKWSRYYLSIARHCSKYLQLEPKNGYHGLRWFQLCGLCFQIHALVRPILSQGQTNIKLASTSGVLGSTDSVKQCCRLSLPTGRWMQRVLNQLGFWSEIVNVSASHPIRIEFKMIITSGSASPRRAHMILNDMGWLVLNSKKI